MELGTPAAVQGAEAAFGDAWTVIRELAADPIGGMTKEYARLGPGRSLRVGGILAVVAALLATIGTMNGVGAVMGGLGAFGRGGDSASAFFQILVATLIFIAAASGAGFLARRMQSANTVFAADLFTVGAATLPMGIAMLLAGLIGAWQLAALLTLTGLVYFILMLYTGLTALGLLSIRLAPLVVAAMLVTGILITQSVM